MNASIPSLVLAMFAFTAQAGEFDRWARVKQDGRGVLYVDVLTLGNGPATARKAWILHDYSADKISRSSDSAKSEKYLYLVDCVGSRLGVRTVVEYSEHMGRGRAVFTGAKKDGEVDFEDVVPGSFAENILHIACSKTR